MKTSFYKQQDRMDCGPTCLRMIAKHYGRSVNIQKLRELCYVNKQGVNLLGISEGAEKIGFRTTGAKISIDHLKDMQLPCILHWKQNHFVVLYKISKSIFYIADPARGLIKVNEKDFQKAWYSYSSTDLGIILAISPGIMFHDQEDDHTPHVSWTTILKYFFEYKKLFLQLILGLFVGTIFALLAPFLTQAIVDVGINSKSIRFIYLLLIGQVMLFIGGMTVNFIRSWILLHISTRINISILTDFLIKLMMLPMSFFENKTTGDIMQRMSDQQKIESFLTGTALSTVFSIINLIVFNVALTYFDYRIFFISIISTLIYICWITFFLNKRREINQKQFDISSKSQSSIVELVNGMQEIKLNNFERQKRWAWEHIQAKLFKNKMLTLTMNQYQQGGAQFINQIKNILVTFFSVKAVIMGQLSLGGMMAIQYIIGQISGPIEQMLTFVQTYQDAKISLERLNDVHQLPNEEVIGKNYLTELPEDKGIFIKNLTFRYPGAGNEAILDNLTFRIPEGKITAIVGMSGSGKTTLLKLLLRFYEPESGEIKVGNTNLNQFNFKSWRNACGTVMQDGFIFSDTIGNNIAVGDQSPNQKRLQHAIDVANISEFVSDLPFGLNTKIGAGGSGISQGQKQRLLIARAVYKNPDYLFFDEATNALDSNNEKAIMTKLSRFLNGKTVVVVAHRLSTVTSADNIIVMEKGRIIEQGTHESLCETGGEYFELVRNQLGLGV